MSNDHRGPSQWSHSRFLQIATVVAVGAALWLHVVGPIVQRERIIYRIRLAGGKVGRAEGRKWLSSEGGDGLFDRFRTIDRVNLDRADVSEELLAGVAALVGLRS